MKAIVSVLGKDKLGIIAKVSNLLFTENINIEDISQTILQNRFFTMIMMVDMEKSQYNISQISNELNKLGKELGVEIRIQHEDVFNAMHKLSN
jgi:ACT domain-containing protein